MKDLQYYIFVISERSMLYMAYVAQQGKYSLVSCGLRFPQVSWGGRFVIHWDFPKISPSILKVGDLWFTEISPVIVKRDLWLIFPQLSQGVRFMIHWDCLKYPKVWDWWFTGMSPSIPRHQIAYLLRVGQVLQVGKYLLESGCCSQATVTSPCKVLFMFEILAVGPTSLLLSISHFKLVYVITAETISDS